MYLCTSYFFSIYSDYLKHIFKEVKIYKSVRFLFVVESIPGGYITIQAKKYKIVSIHST